MTGQHIDTDENIGVIPGRKAVAEALVSSPEKIEGVYLQSGQKGGQVEQIVALCRERGIRFRFLSRTELNAMFSGNHQGVAARYFAGGFGDLSGMLRSALNAPLPLLVVLDKVQDPGNVGVLSRTLYALGGAGLIVPKDGGAALGGGAMKSSAGALSMLPVVKVVNVARALDECRDAGFTVYVADAGERSTEIFSAGLSMPAVLVLGGEEKGVRPNVARRADYFLKIPFLRSFDSLNVAQAGAIMIAEFMRTRILK